MNYYELLQIHQNADDEVIDAAYRALAKKYHPDSYKGDVLIANLKMKELNLAHDTLKDGTKRLIYDQSLNSDKNSTYTSSYNKQNDADEKLKKKEAEEKQAREYEEKLNRAEEERLRREKDAAIKRQNEFEERAKQEEQRIKKAKEEKRRREAEELEIFKKMAEEKAKHSNENNVNNKKTFDKEIYYNKQYIFMIISFCFLAVIAILIIILGLRDLSNFFY